MVCLTVRPAPQMERAGGRSGDCCHLSSDLSLLCQDPVLADRCLPAGSFRSWRPLQPCPGAGLQARARAADLVNAAPLFLRGISAWRAPTGSRDVRIDA